MVREFQLLEDLLPRRRTKAFCSLVQIESGGDSFSTLPQLIASKVVSGSVPTRHLAWFSASSCQQTILHLRQTRAKVRVLFESPLVIKKK
jgi:hypothetical protein